MVAEIFSLGGLFSGALIFMPTRTDCPAVHCTAGRRPLKLLGLIWVEGATGHHIVVVPLPVGTWNANAGAPERKGKGTVSGSALSVRGSADGPPSQGSFSQQDVGLPVSSTAPGRSCTFPRGRRGLRTRAKGCSIEALCFQPLRVMQFWQRLGIGWAGYLFGGSVL